MESGAAKMLSADGNQPIGKPGRRKRKGPQSRKAAQRKEAGQQQDHTPVPLQDAHEEISALVASSDSSPTDTSATETSSTVPVVSAKAAAVSPQTIANAYGDYARKSLEQTWSFFERLAAVRSPDKAFEVQTEFAKQAYETFIADSQKILELQSELARQRVVYLEGFVVRMTQTTFVLRTARN
ncbi:phasin family protein [Bradyrhizobium erythrophlei]|uniref:phasin family protein n=1 Tax=Bradyrhizobium erythrophlei TaxID=1437360 RepID=UPI0035EA65BE